MKIRIIPPDRIGCECCDKHYKTHKNLVKHLYDTLRIKNQVIGRLRKVGLRKLEMIKWKEDKFNEEYRDMGIIFWKLKVKLKEIYEIEDIEVAKNE